MSAKSRIFVTGDHPDLREILESGGFEVIDRERILPGQDLEEAMRSADVALLVYRAFAEPRGLLPPNSWELRAFRSLQESQGLAGIPVLRGETADAWPSAVAEISSRKPLLLSDPASPVEQMLGDPAAALSRNRDLLLAALERWRSESLRSATQQPARSPKPSGPPLLLREVRLANIGCFESLQVSLDSGWTTILGDNAAGKTTLLRSLGIGLCSESEAAALIKSLERPVLRHGASRGEIHLELRDPEKNDNFSIKTTIEIGPAGDEEVRKFPQPLEFPWDRLFVCGYGTNRSLRATKSYEEYFRHTALGSLFDESLPLHNTELILRRRENGIRRVLERRLLTVMMLDEAQFVYSYRGVSIEAAWGTQPIQSLSDGYRSTLQWVADFCQWAVHAERFGMEGVEGGVLLIDELEQHLHPRWQRYIVKRLSEQFPGTQFVVSTHTPLVAAGVADLESGQVVLLLEKANGTIDPMMIRPQELWGLRADQILSDAFGLVTSSNVESETAIDRYSALLGKPQRSEEEVTELENLRVQLQEHFSLGASKTEREAEIIVRRVLDELNTDLSKEKIGFEARQLLQDLLRPRSE